MKLKSVFFLLLSTVILFTSCKDDDDKDTVVMGISLSESSVSIKPGDLKVLTATVTPQGAAAVTWRSSNDAVATVSQDGVVTGVADGTTIVTASAGAYSDFCTVVVGEGGDNGNGGGTGTIIPDLTKCTNFYVLFMDAVTFTRIPASDIVEDLRPDGEQTNSLDIWDKGDSYKEAPASGPNSFGEVEGWIALMSNQEPWGGIGAGGIRQQRNFDMSGIDNTYTFHCAYKSKDGDKNEVGLVSLDGGEPIWMTLPARTDGEWCHYEIPMSTFLLAGWSFPRPYIFSGEGRYSLTFRSSPANTILELDAVYIYKAK